MQITLNITEDSKVELVKDTCELVQGECCFTDFVFNFPATIKGHAVSEYSKYIEFAECKDLGECVKFVDEIDGNTYSLNDACTAFKKIIVQIVLERIADGHKITWKTVPFTLEFVESVNANGAAAIQAQLLCLEQIKQDWEAYIKANTIRMVYRLADVPKADENSLATTIFYLGQSVVRPQFDYNLTYGRYYVCRNIDGVYDWIDIVGDVQFGGVADSFREINNNRVFQIWVGEDAKEEEKHDNVLYVDENEDCGATVAEMLAERAGDSGKVDIGEYYIPLKKSVYRGEVFVEPNTKEFVTDIILPVNGAMYEITGYRKRGNYDFSGWDKDDTESREAVYLNTYDGEDGEGYSKRCFQAMRVSYDPFWTNKTRNSVEFENVQFFIKYVDGQPRLAIRTNYGRLGSPIAYGFSDTTYDENGEEYPNTTVGGLMFTESNRFMAEDYDNEGNALGTYKTRYTGSNFILTGVTLVK